MFKKRKYDSTNLFLQLICFLVDFPFPNGDLTKRSLISKQLSHKINTVKTVGNSGQFFQRALKGN